MVSSPILMFADDTKIFRVIRNKEDHSALQNDLNLLYEWSLQWQLNFNVVKCKHLHFGAEHFFGSFYLNSTVIDSVISHKDLGITFDNHLKFHDHTTEVTAKANCLLGLIRKSFEYLEPDMLVTLFVTIDGLSGGSRIFEKWFPSVVDHRCRGLGAQPPAAEEVSIFTSIQSIENLI